MTSDMNNDSLELTMMEPEPERAARVLARCHQRLERRKSRTEKIERAVVAGFSLVYLAAAVNIVLSVFLAT
jgi:hypothetical protein